MFNTDILTRTTANLEKEERYRIINQDISTYPEEIERLAFFLAENHELFKEFIKTIREHACIIDKQIQYVLTQNEVKQRDKFLLLSKMTGGILMNVRFDLKKNIIVGRVSGMPKAIRFITGQYMEIVVAKRTRKILESMGLVIHKDFELLKNAVIADGVNKNEFDIMLQVGAYIYAIEVKSGIQFDDYEKYYHIGKCYGIVPNRFILMNSSIESELTESIHYFTEYYVTNLEGYENTLKAMIKADME